MKRTGITQRVYLKLFAPRLTMTDIPVSVITSLTEDFPEQIDI